MYYECAKDAPGYWKCRIICWILNKNPFRKGDYHWIMGKNNFLVRNFICL